MRIVANTLLKIALISVCLTPFVTVAQTPTLIKDINSTPLGIQPRELVRFGNSQQMLFRADDALHGFELWISDGTSAGTKMLADINPGPEGSFPDGFTFVNTAAGPRMFFSATHPDSGTELWVTDGTEDGTDIVQDLEPGAGSSTPAGLTAAGVLLLFSAETSANGREPWRSNGTTITLIKEIAPGSFSSMFITSDTKQFIVLDGGLGVVFAAGAASPESDLYFAPSFNPLDIQPVSGTSGTFPNNLTKFGPSSVLYAANFTGAGRELIKFAFPGTVTLVEDINLTSAGAGSSNPRNITVLGSKALFSATDGVGVDTNSDLFVTDGIGSGTFELLDINSIGSSPIREIVAGASEWLISMETSATGAEIFKSNGTIAGTTLVKDIVPGSDSSNPSNLIAFGTNFLFSASDPLLGEELFISNGTPGGTLVLHDLFPAVFSSFPDNPVSFGATIRFTAQTPNGERLFSTNGSSAGLAQLAELTIAGKTEDSDVEEVISHPDFVIFFAEDMPEGEEISRTDGTAAGTFLVKDIVPGKLAGLDDDVLHVSGKKIFFASRNTPDGNELWVSDGTEAGTNQVKDIFPGANDSSPQNFATLNGKVYFAARAPLIEKELFVTDGTEAGTILVKDIHSSGESSPSNLTTVGNRIFFSAIDEASFQRTLFVTDGTTSGTLRVVDPTSPNYPAEVSRITAFGDIVLFRAQHPVLGLELWRSDGTEQGTFVIKDLFPATQLSQLRDLVVAEDRAFFSVFNSGNGDGLFVTDGTLAGTGLVRSFSIIGSIRELFPIGNKTLIEVEENPFGGELWISDGSDAGTTLLKDIRPGSEGSFPTGFVGVDSFVYFGARNSSEQGGKQIWRTDGTSAGTIQITSTDQNNFEGPNGEMVNFKGTLIFGGERDDVGEELFKFTADLCPDDPARLTPNICGCGVAEEDLNANAVIDCLKTPELRARLLALQALAKKIKKKGSTTKAKKKAKLLKQKILSALSDVQTFAAANVDGINVQSGSNLNSSLTELSKKLKRALKGLDTVKQDKKKFNKVVNGIIAILIG